MCRYKKLPTQARKQCASGVSCTLCLQCDAVTVGAPRMLSCLKAGNLEEGAYLRTRFWLMFSTMTADLSQAREVSRGEPPLGGNVEAVVANAELQTHRKSQLLKSYDRVMQRMHNVLSSVF